jgi:hypothetical protein
MAVENSTVSDVRDDGTGADLLYHLESDASREEVVNSRLWVNGEDNAGTGHDNRILFVQHHGGTGADNHFRRNPARRQRKKGRKRYAFRLTGIARLSG